MDRSSDRIAQWQFDNMPLENGQPTRGHKDYDSVETNLARTERCKRVRPETRFGHQVGSSFEQNETVSPVQTCSIPRTHLQTASSETPDREFTARSAGCSQSYWDKKAYRVGEIHPGVLVSSGTGQPPSRLVATLEQRFWLLPYLIVTLTATVFSGWTYRDYSYAQQADFSPWELGLDYLAGFGGFPLALLGMLMAWGLMSTAPWRLRLLVTSLTCVASGILFLTAVGSPIGTDHLPLANISSQILLPFATFLFFLFAFNRLLFPLQLGRARSTAGVAQVDSVRPPSTPWKSAAWLTGVTALLGLWAVVQVNPDLQSNLWLAPLLSGVLLAFLLQAFLTALAFTRGRYLRLIVGVMILTSYALAANYPAGLFNILTMAYPTDVRLVQWVLWSGVFGWALALFCLLMTDQMPEIRGNYLSEITPTAHSRIASRAKSVVPSFVIRPAVLFSIAVLLLLFPIAHVVPTYHGLEFVTIPPSAENGYSSRLPIVTKTAFPRKTVCRVYRDNNIDRLRPVPNEESFDLITVSAHVTTIESLQKALERSRAITDRLIIDGISLTQEQLSGLPDSWIDATIEYRNVMADNRVLSKLRSRNRVFRHCTFPENFCDTYQGGELAVFDCQFEQGFLDGLQQRGVRTRFEYSKLEFLSLSEATIETLLFQQGFLLQQETLAGAEQRFADWLARQPYSSFFKQVLQRRFTIDGRYPELRKLQLGADYPWPQQTIRRNFATSDGELTSLRISNIQHWNCFDFSQTSFTKLQELSVLLPEHLSEVLIEKDRALRPQHLRVLQMLPGSTWLRMDLAKVFNEVDLSSLKTLALPGKPKDLTHELKRLENLEELSWVQSLPITAGDLQFVQDLPNLKHLRITIVGNVNYSPKSLKSVQQQCLKALPSIPDETSVQLVLDTRFHWFNKPLPNALAGQEYLQVRDGLSFSQTQSYQNVSTLTDNVPYKQ